jgi:hypothetical protein
VLDIRRAADHAGLDLKALQIDMEIDKGQLSRQMEGDGHLSLTRLSRIQSCAFWRWFALLQSQRHGLPDEVNAAIDLQPRMAKMGLPTNATKSVAS